MNDDLARARAESAALLNLNPDKLSPAGALKCDLVSALRLVIDDELARAMSGSGADLGKLKRGSRLWQTRHVDAVFCWVI
jgi:hypothetical protein